MKYIKFALSLTLGVVLFWVLQTRWGNIPPMGPFMDPDEGFWANAERKGPMDNEFSIDGLKDSVQVYFDDRRVPHVFAQNDYDLYYIENQSFLLDLVIVALTGVAVFKGTGAY